MFSPNNKEGSTVLKTFLIYQLIDCIIASASKRIKTSFLINRIICPNDLAGYRDLWDIADDIMICREENVKHYLKAANAQIMAINNQTLKQQGADFIFVCLRERYASDLIGSGSSEDEAQRLAYSIAPRTLLLLYTMD